jgi:hypothetical protein
VSCTENRICIAVGGERVHHHSSVPLAERWNGRRWTIQNPPAPMDSRARRGTSFSSVACTSRAEACTAIGNYGKSGWFIEQYSQT